MEIELVGFPVSLSMFDLLPTQYRGDILAKNLIDHVGKTVEMVGDFVDAKYVPTKKGTVMNFGTWLDVEGNFIDTVHFPQTLRHSPLKGAGLYLIKGKVVEEFGFPSIEVERMARLPIKAD